MRSRPLDIKLNQIINENYLLEDFNTSKLASLVGVSERTLFRQCLEATSLTPSSLIRQFKIGKAKDLLKKGFHTSEVAVQSGYQSERAMRLAFERETGQTVSSFKKAVKGLSQREVELNDKILDIVHSNYQSKEFTVLQLAALVGTKERTLYRHCKDFLSTTPLNLIRRYRVEQAKALLRDGMSIDSVVDRTGFSSMRAFEHAFKAETGLSASSYISDPTAAMRQPLVHKIEAYLGKDLNLDSDEQIKVALREKMSIFLPQRGRLSESIQASNSDHDVLSLLLEYRNSNRD